MRAQDRSSEAYQLLRANLAVNQYSAPYLEALGFVAIEAGATEEGEQFLYQALVLNDQDRELSRAINTWSITGSIPAQKLPLAGATDGVQTDLAPPLNLNDQHVQTSFRTASATVRKNLLSLGHEVEAARLERTVRLLLLDDAAVGSPVPADERAR